MAEDIPAKVKKRNIQFLIIDFSGLFNIDSMALNYLFQISSTMKLLGVHPVLTGLRPELAQKVVNPGVDLTSLQTMATVEQAVNHLSKRTA